MSYFTPDGLCVPATVIALEEGNIVTAVKTQDTDGYNAVQVGYKVVEPRKVNKPETGHLAKAGAPPMKHLGEFRVGFLALSLIERGSSLFQNTSSSFAHLICSLAFHYYALCS